MKYKIIGYNNTDITKYECETFTHEEAIATAKYFNTCCGCELVIVKDITTNQYVYAID